MLPRLYHSNSVPGLGGVIIVTTADEYRYLIFKVDVYHHFGRFGYFLAPDNKIYAMASSTYTPRSQTKLYQLSTRAKDHLTLDDCCLRTNGSWGFYYKNRMLVDKSRHVIMASLVDPSDPPPWLVEFELTALFCNGV
jgi:hypothetical protein